MLRFLILGSVLLITSFTYSQDNKDSLLNVINLSAEDEEKLNAYLSLSTILATSYPDSSIIMSEKAIALAKEIKNRKAEAQGYYYLGIGYLQLGQFQNSDEALEESMKIFEEINDIDGYATSLAKSGNIKLYLGDKDESFKRLNKALLINKKNNDEESIAASYASIASANFNLGNFKEAILYFDSSSTFYRKAGDLAQYSKLNYNIGLIYTRLSNYDSAFACFERTIKIGKKVKEPNITSAAYDAKGISHLERSEINSALKSFIKALQIRTEYNLEDKLAASYCNIGLVHFNQDSLKKAREYFEKSLEYAEPRNDIQVLPAAYGNLGIIYKQNGEYNKTEALYNKSLKISRNLNDKYGECRTLGNFGNLYMVMGKYDEALAFLKQARAMKIEIGASKDLVYDITAIGWINFLLSTDSVRNRYYDIKPQIFKPKAIHLSKAEKLENRVIELIDSINGEKNQKAQALEHLTHVYKAQGNYKKALEVFEQYKLIQDSLSSKERTEKIAGLQAVQEKLETEKELELANERELILNEAANKRQNLIFALVAGLTLLLFLSILIIRRYQIGKKQNLIIAEQKEKLTKLDEVKNNFFTNITHEFRTPLTVILGAAGNLGDTEDSNLIKRNGQRLLKLINQILDLSKLEDGSLTVNKKQVDAIGYTKYLIDSYRSLALSQNKTLNYKSEVDEQFMDLDEDKYQTIVGNLVSNAIKFTPKNGAIAVKTKSENHNLIIEVKDSGPGIPENEIENLFDRFYQVKGSKEQKIGSGVGLALTKELVELFNGKIEVKNHSDGGAIFIVSLPIANNKAKADIKKIAKEKPVDIRPDSMENLAEEISEKPILLLVEDEPDIQSFVKATLQSEYTVLVANNGATGIDIALEKVPDIILSDVMMPEKDGLELTNELKNDIRTSHIPIVLLTAKVDLESRLQGLKRGADVYLPKPFEKEELLLQLNNLYQQQIRTREHYNKTIGKVEETKELQFDEVENAFILQLNETLTTDLSNEDFGIEDLNKALGMSRTQLHRKLKALTGKSTTQYINEFKVEKACELLIQPESNVAEVAYALGFSDPNYFSRVFTKIKNTSPTEFIRLNKSN